MRGDECVVVVVVVVQRLPWLNGRHELGCMACGGYATVGRIVQWMGLCSVCWLSVDVCGILIGSGGGGGVGGVGSSSSGVGFAKVVALSFGNQALFQAINTLQKSFENIGLGASFFGHGICRAAVSSV